MSLFWFKTPCGGSRGHSSSPQNALRRPQCDPWSASSPVLYGRKPRFNRKRILQFTKTNSKWDPLRSSCRRSDQFLRVRWFNFFFLDFDLNFCRTDSQNELEKIKNLCLSAGAFDAVICSHWAEGGKGAVELGTAVLKATEQKSDFKYREYSFCNQMILYL